LEVAILSVAKRGKGKGFGGTNGIIVSDRLECFVASISTIQITLSIANIPSSAPAAIRRLDSIV
jgi:hypothetical protein